MTRVAAALLVVLAVAAVYAASRLTFGSARQPETGFFPTLVAAALVLFSGLALAERPREPESAQPDATARTWVVIGAVAVYAALIQPAGFVVCTFALLLLLLRGIGQLSWTASALTSLIAAVACYELFTQLGMPLPAGILRI